MVASLRALNPQFKSFLNVGEIMKILFDSHFALTEI